MDLPAAVARVAEVLVQGGATGRPVVLPDAARTAAEAAAALQVPVGAIANSLVFSADGEPVLVLTSGAHRVDTAWLSGQLGLAPLVRATPDEVRGWTGQVIGGVSPVGHPHPLRTVVDRWLEQHDVVWAAAGHPHAVFPTTCTELVQLTAGQLHDVVPPSRTEPSA